MIPDDFDDMDAWIERQYEALANDDDAPDDTWAPLELVRDHLHGEAASFMFMEHDQSGRLYYYKHSSTRSALILDRDGNAYGPTANGGLQQVPTDQAARRALLGFHPEVTDEQLEHMRPWNGS